MVENGFGVPARQITVWLTLQRRADADGNLFGRCVKHLQYIMNFKSILLYHVILNLYFMGLILILKSEKGKT